MNDSGNFKDRFNEALNIKNISPAELSKKTGISESTISQYRSGYSKPKKERLEIIAKALSVNPVWLMGFNTSMIALPLYYEDNEMGKALRLHSMNESLKVTEEDYLLIKQFKSLNDEGKKKVLEYLEMIEKLYRK